METSPIFLKERTNNLELKPLLHKILNEESDPHLTEKTKIALREVGQNALKQRQVLGKERWNYSPLMEVYVRVNSVIYLRIFLEF